MSLPPLLDRWVLLMVVVAAAFLPVVKIYLSTFGKGSVTSRLDAAASFVAFYFLLLGLRLMINPAGDPGFLPALFAALSLTYFWVM